MEETKSPKQNDPNFLSMLQKLEDASTSTSSTIVNNNIKERKKEDKLQLNNQPWIYANS